MHLYTLVAAPFVMELLAAASPPIRWCGENSSWIQAAFLAGWALGGGFFGRIGDRLGPQPGPEPDHPDLRRFHRPFAICATPWWHLLIFRFLAALGIGGEWAVGARSSRRPGPAPGGPGSRPCSRPASTSASCSPPLTVYLMADLPPRNVFLVGRAARAPRLLDPQARARAGGMAAARERAPAREPRPRRPFPAPSSADRP